MRLRTKFAALAVTAGIAVTATAAFGYWSTTGSGSGNATAASGNGTLALTASFADGLAPGQSTTVTYHAVNASDTDLQVGTVHAVVSTDKDGCDAAWFAIGDVISNQVIAHQSDADLTNTGTLFFNNNAADQNACKGAKVTLTLSS